MAQRGRFRRWTIDNKLTFWGIVAAAVVATAAIVVPLLVTNGGGNSATVATNNGQVNIGGTVNNYAASPGPDDPNPSGPSVESSTCPVQKSPQKGSVDTLAVDLFVRPYRNGECWGTSSAVGQTPSTVEFEISYTNTSQAPQRDVVFGIKLAKGLQMVPGSTYIENSTHPKGKQLDTDAIDGSGIIIGSYSPGANGFVAFEATTPAIRDLKCGSNVLRTIASVQPKGLDYFYNTADVDLTRPCASPSTSG